jgi:RNA polymerase sigma-70 factor (ECF subfamily)
MIHAAEMEVAVGASPDEFAIAVADHRSRVFAFLLQMVGNREDAMDLLQEGFLKLHTKWHLRDPERPLAPWMYRIFRNLAIDHIRKRNRRKVFQLNPERHGTRSGKSTRSLLKIQLWQAVNRSSRGTAGSLHTA